MSFWYSTEHKRENWKEVLIHGHKLNLFKTQEVNKRHSKTEEFVKNKNSQSEAENEAVLPDNTSPSKLQDWIVPRMVVFSIGRVYF